LRLGQVAHGHALGDGDLGRVAQIPLGVERGLAAGAGGGDRLAIDMIDNIAGRKDTRPIRPRGTPLDLYLAIRVELDLPGD
jgi:hypothetical protein